MTSFTTISADSHVVEPPNLWVDLIDPQYRDRAPHVEHTPDGDLFVCDGANLMQVGVSATAGRPGHLAKMMGTYENDARAGAWDPHPRLAELAVDGVEAEVFYSSVAAMMFQINDAGYQEACFKAYNTWIADFCGAYPDRFKGVAQISVRNVPNAVREVERAKELGLSGIGIPVTTDATHKYSDREFDALWAVAAETGMPVSLHVTTNEGQVAGMAPPSPVDGMVGQSIFCADPMQSLAHMVFSGVFRRFPELKVVTAEYEISWAAYFVQRMDLLWDKRAGLTTLDMPRDTLPSEYFHRNVYMTFMRDGMGVKLRHELGLDHLMWSTDYPHLDSTWPESQKFIDDICQGVPADERHKIIAENAAALYGFN